MNLLKELDKSGFVIIENVGMDNPDKTLEETMATIATPIAYLGLPMVMDLKPQPGFQPASYAGTGNFDMHTDLSWHEKPPKYLGMFCVRMEAAGGGIPLLADGWQALKMLAEEDIEYLKTAPVTFPPPSHIDYAPLTGPIITEKNGKPFIRFRYDMLENPAEPVRRFFEAINQCIFEVKVSPGSIFFFDNGRMLHGRTELKAALDSDRHFKRIYGDV
jgi:alpha-ketoglutarate-dependent taurine dioxygenase